MILRSKKTVICHLSRFGTGPDDAQKEAEKHTPSRKRRLVFMFGKYAFGNEDVCEKYPEILDFAFLRLYLCNVDNEKQTHTNN